jgi:nitroimidazol reductase NimA-like FMN-containing flavoprotein (pyridoxamine 5'-phosphate oxidase superfamily)
MSEASVRVDELSDKESIELLQMHSYVGRVGFVVDGEVSVLPVNYLAEDEAIFFCTSAGTKLSALRDGARVAFEVDDSRALDHAGWSVLVHGTSQEVTDPRELDRLRRGPLKSWAVPVSEHWIRISIDSVSGRKIPKR